MITDQLNNDPEELTTSLNFPGNSPEETESDEDTQPDFYEAEVIPDEADDLDDASQTDDGSAEEEDPDDSDDVDDTDPVSPDEAANEDEALENEPLDEEV